MTRSSKQCRQKTQNTARRTNKFLKEQVGNADLCIEKNNEHTQTMHKIQCRSFFNNF